MSNSYAGDSICGNGIVEFSEDCDDGTLNSDVAVDGCRMNCRRAYCGDHIIDTGEECDERTYWEQPNSCRRDCTIPFCGDGIVDDGEMHSHPYRVFNEECDDGNDNDHDGCSNQCKINIDITQEAVQAGDALKFFRAGGASANSTSSESGSEDSDARKSAQERVKKRGEESTANNLADTYGGKSTEDKFKNGIEAQQVLPEGQSNSSGKQTGTPSVERTPGSTSSRTVQPGKRDIIPKIEKKEPLKGDDKKQDSPLRKEEPFAPEEQPQIPLNALKVQQPILPESGQPQQDNRLEQEKQNIYNKKINI